MDDPACEAAKMPKPVSRGWLAFRQGNRERVCFCKRVPKQQEQQITGPSVILDGAGSVS